MPANEDFISAKFVLVLEIFAMTIILVGISISLILWPEPTGFNFIEYTISYLGSPKGTDFYWIFSFSLIISSPLLLPLIMRIRMQLNKNKSRDIVTILHLLIPVGLILVAVFPGSMKALHNTGAAMIFGGFLFGALFFSKAVSKGSSFNEDYIPILRRTGLIFFLITIPLVIIAGILYLAAGSNLKEPGAFLEWIAMFLLLSYLVILTACSIKSPLVRKDRA